MNWDALRLFLDVARHASLSRASDDIKLSVATIARKLDSLEHALGVRLVLRTPRGLRLTQAGAALQRRAEASRLQMADVERFAATLGDAARVSTVRISATEPVIGEVLAPALPTLLAGHPSLRVDLKVENALASLSLNESDIAVRLVRPQGGSLMAKRLKPLAMALYCSSKDHGRFIRQPDERLAPQAPFISYDDSYGAIPEVLWISENGLEPNVRVRTSSTRAMVNAAAAGAGIAILPKLFGARRAELAEVKPTGLTPVPDRLAWIVWHRDNARLPMIRQTCRWIADAFAAAAHPSRPSTGNTSSSQ
jgi:DNA-binding transcriptional LysR family regulator